MDIFILFNKLKHFVVTYKELFILLGTIILVWLAVVMAIKKFVKKDEKSNFYEDQIKDKR